MGSLLDLEVSPAIFVERAGLGQRLAQNPSIRPMISFCTSVVPP
jgi:hypothetical protein